MKKFTATILLLAMVLLCGCTSGAAETPGGHEATHEPGTDAKPEVDWNPPVKGLTWGMSMEEALKMLDGEDYSISESSKDYSTAIYAAFTEPQEITYSSVSVSVEELKLGFDSFYEGSPLITLSGVCIESDIPGLYSALDAQFGDYATTVYPDDIAIWEKGLVCDLPDIEQIMETFHMKYGDAPAYESMRTALYGSPLVRIELRLKGKSAGLLWMQAGKQTLVDFLRRESGQ